jgi:hypothetical protein
MSVCNSPEETPTNVRACKQTRRGGREEHARESMSSQPEERRPLGGGSQGGEVFRRAFPRQGFARACFKNVQVQRPAYSGRWQSGQRPGRSARHAVWTPSGNARGGEADLLVICTVARPYWADWRIEGTRVVRAQCECGPGLGRCVGLVA